MERMNSFGLNPLRYVEKAKPQKNAVRKQIQSGAGGQQCIAEAHEEPFWSPTFGLRIRNGAFKIGVHNNPCTLACLGANLEGDLQA